MANVPNDRNKPAHEMIRFLMESVDHAPDIDAALVRDVAVAGALVAGGPLRHPCLRLRTPHSELLVQRCRA
ncbi:hypothetical protein ACFYWX_20095 [Streptomyces sp. NPDC002888]|uniref:hypothetical protein n=1 Tax=Streptomyces sp. NPDC002888 TaxID=3364668 RepID=UPI00369C8FE5